MIRLGIAIHSHTAPCGSIARSQEHSRTAFVSVVTTTVLVLALLVHGARTQEMAVPVSIQVPLLMKVISTDRKLKERSGNELVIGVFYQPRFRASAETMESFIDAAGPSPTPPVAGQSVRVLPIPIDEQPDWDTLIASNELDICYIAPLRALGIAGLLPAARSQRAATCTGVLEYVEAGVSIGFDSRGGKPQIVINMSAAKAEGIDFSSQLLKLARIIEKD